MDGIWDTILELGRRLPPERWALIGGQMVVLHGLARGRQPVRITRDTDHGVIDIVAPDHSSPTWPLTTVPPRRTLRVDGGRQALDAAFLAGLIDDPRELRGTFKGSDRKRLLALNRVIGQRHHPAWRALGDAADDAHLSWRLLTST